MIARTNVGSASTLAGVAFMAVLMAWAGTAQARSDVPARAAYLDGGDSKVGVILLHGRGKDPRWKVVDPLRRAVHRQLGFHTLSLQMPAADKPWRQYAGDFPRAYQEIEAGIAFLRDSKNVETIYLMGHSMGSRMGTAYLARHPDAPIAGFIGVGVRNRGDAPLDSNQNLRRISLPVVDIYGDGGDGVDLQDARARADMVSDRYTQVLIPGADHTFDRGQRQMVKAVIDWLSERN
jgi:alpha/beta superfamily hydrolase